MISTEMPVLESCYLHYPSLLQANPQLEVRLPRNFCATRSLVPLSTSHDRETYRRSTSEHILLFSGHLPTILAQARAYMSQVATYHICMSTDSTSPTVLHPGNACAEHSRLLARHSAYRRTVRRISRARTAKSRGRGQYHDRTDAV